MWGGAPLLLLLSQKLSSFTQPMNVANVLVHFALLQRNTWNWVIYEDERVIWPMILLAERLGICWKFRLLPPVAEGEGEFPNAEITWQERKQENTWRHQALFNNQVCWEVIKGELSHSPHQGRALYIHEGSTPMIQYLPLDPISNTGNQISTWGLEGTNIKTVAANIRT